MQGEAKTSAYELDSDLLPPSASSSSEVEEGEEGEEGGDADESSEAVGEEADARRHHVHRTYNPNYRRGLFAPREDHVCAPPPYLPIRFLFAGS